MNYGALIERAGRMILRHRYLWVLGLLGGGEAFSAPTGFPGSFGGPVPGSVPRSNVYYFGPSPAPSWMPFTNQGGSVDMGSFFADHPGAVAAIIVGVLLVFVIGALFFFFLGPVSTGGLVRAAVEHDDGRPFAFGQAWQAGLRTFWRVLGLRLLEIVVLLFALGILGIVALISLAASGFTAGSFGSLGLVFVLILLVSIATQVVFTLAVRAAVMDDRSITQALESSIALVRRRLGPVALVWVISIAISIGIAIALLVALAIIAIPFVLLGVITYAAGAGIGIPLVLGILVAVVVLLVAVGGSGAFVSVLWTLAYRRFEGEPASAVAPAAS
ncbi:MAG: hypothetical protein E6J01_03335 [Chloroflexi bacterium]|nr:MAG: hypothetical protein E6J01_03335 [Chloroflexota bacterium]